MLKTKLIGNAEVSLSSEHCSSMMKVKLVLFMPILYTQKKIDIKAQKNMSWTNVPLLAIT